MPSLCANEVLWTALFVLPGSNYREHTSFLFLSTLLLFYCFIDYLHRYAVLLLSEFALQLW